VWIAPLGQLQNQESIQDQTAFRGKTYGVVSGAHHLFLDNLSFGGGVGYTHTAIDWKESAGDGDINSAYMCTTLGWHPKDFNLTFAALGAFNHYELDRQIHLPGIERVAHSHHHSYEVLLNATTSYNYRFKGGNTSFILTPEVGLSYLNIFENSYTETGAGSINLHVNSKYTAFLRPEALLKFGVELQAGNAVIIPSLKMGWVSNLTLSSGNYVGEFSKQKLCASHFVVKSFHLKSNQALIGGNLFIKGFKNFTYDLGYEAQIFDKSVVQSANMNFNWKF
jgi:outer membrane autotransporter protein